MLEQPITLDELKATLKTCDESAPGPDGLTYKTIEHSWDVVGPLILDSWNLSQNIGMTSSSQRHAVITLLEKKGKDKAKLENLRPISLSNCDIKLCTKALALRTNKVLPSILSVTQTGYVPGRQVNDNSRLLEEIINKYKNSGNTAYLITLDARKAFDSVNHEYLFHILSLFDFPPLFINNVKTIYNSLSASVLVNGYTSDTFNIEQSVKQGDALSCALFIIAIEPLLRQINSNNNISGINLTNDENGESFTLKNMSFADDITALCTNIEGIQHIIDEYVNFSNYSGIKLNIEKTEILVIGKRTNNNTTFNISHNDDTIRIVESKKVKICGITFSNDSEEAYTDNIMEKITKLERQLNIWRQRNLTLQGKILIVKTFDISQLIYSLQATTIRNTELKKIEDIIFRFIWNTKSSSARCIGKIKRDTLKAEINKGGLKAPDITMIDRAIKLKHILRCMDSDHPVSIVIKNEIKDINFKLCSFTKISNSNLPYMQNVIETNKILEKIQLTDIDVMSEEPTGINKFYFELIQNHIIDNSLLFPMQMNNAVKRLKHKGINNLRDLYTEIHNSTKPSIRLDCVLAYNKLPKSWRILLTKSNKTHIISQSNFSHMLNKSKTISNITQKEIYSRLSQDLGISDINGYINTKHNLIETGLNKAFLNVKKVTSVKSLQNVQYKILHNIYPTKLHLFKWKIKENDLCSSCNVTETLKHAIFECDIARVTMSNFEKVISNLLKTNLSLSYTDILIGLTGRNSYYTITRDEIGLIDELLIIIKRCLILQRESKQILSEDRLLNEITRNAKIRKLLRKPLTNLEKQLLT